jgi:SOS-response transcriptional repressor LexA
MLENCGANTIKETLGQTIKRLREARGLNRYRLGKLSGVDSGYITRIEVGAIQPGVEVLKKLAKGLNVPLSNILDDKLEELPIESSSPEERIKDIESNLQRLKLDLKNQIAIPVMGVIPASYPCVVEESYEGDITIPRQLLEGVPNLEKVLALRVQGESLIGDAVLPGDYLFISPMPDIDIEGRVYIVRVHNQCTAKHVYHANGRIRLVASNSDYEDLEPDQVEIVGRVVARYGTM